MNEDLLVALREARNINLDLFSEYLCLSVDCKDNNDIDGYHYWMDRAIDISRANRKLESDIHTISEGKFVL